MQRARKHPAVMETKRWHAAAKMASRAWRAIRLRPPAVRIVARTRLHPPAVAKTVKASAARKRQKRLWTAALGQFTA